MRFEEVAEAEQVVVDYIGRPVPAATPLDQTVGTVKTFRKEKMRYIHRCPFNHCPHHETLNPRQESDPTRFKVSLEDMNSSTTPYSRTTPRPPVKWADDLKQSHYVARGGGTPANSKEASQFRQRAVLFMLNRLKATQNVHTRTQSRLLTSILTLERRVFEESHSKESYMENLAAKLFLISQELEKRRKMSTGAGVQGPSKAQSDTSQRQDHFSV